MWTNVDERVLKAIADANQYTVDGCVGNDSYSLSAIEMVQNQFNDEIYATFTINGTGANIIAMKAMLDCYSSIICANETHINVYETGAMFGEMVVFRRKAFATHLAYIQKQSFQHFDKSKFLGAQFVCLLENNLWLENAEKSNKNAKTLEKLFLEKGIKSYYPVESNMVFVPINEEQMQNLSTKYDLHYWNEDLKIVRFAATANTTQELMEQLVNSL